MTDPTPADSCRPIEVDGENVLVRGSGDWTEEDQRHMAEIVRAAKRRYEAEHPAEPARRHTVTSDELDRLYARIETLEYVARSNLRHVQLIVPDLEAATKRAERAEAAIERVRAYAHELRHKDAMGLLAALDEQQEQQP
jgi:hypothetical protein